MEAYMRSGSLWLSLSSIFTQTFVPFHLATWYDPCTEVLERNPPTTDQIDQRFFIDT